ncbi:MAG: response regulator [Candidatus Hydrogenedentales bacterium]|jgi:HD-like signal output (HDOD) protein
MKDILFVDDESNILEGLQRMLFVLRHEWNMAFATSGAQALELMEKQHFDVVVSDMRMPGMDGAALLSEVKSRYPDTLRFILTGQSDSETVYRSVGDAHQFLTKPCKASLLRECVDKALALKELMSNSALRGMVTQIATLPPVPAVYTQLCAELKNKDSSVADVGRIIECDPAMTAKILQLVNSAFFGMRQHIATVKQAAALLGFDTIKALVLATGLFSYARKGDPSGRFSIEAIQQHSMLVANYAQVICRGEASLKDMCGEAYTAGLLHDAGMLIMDDALRGEYAHAHDFAVTNGVTLTDAEQALFECTHADVGAYLLGIWGLPGSIVEAVAYHHRPSDCVGDDLSLLTAIHAADALAVALHPGQFEYLAAKIDMKYLGKLGLEELLVKWEASCANFESKKGG